jgi:hypothetical protein
VNDRVFSPVEVQVMLSAHFGVNLYTALWVNKFVTPLWVNDRVISPAQVQAMLPAHSGLNLYSNFQWVNDRVILPIHVWVVLPSGFQIFRPAHFWMYDRVVIPHLVALHAQFWVNKFAAHSHMNSVTTCS